MIFKKFVFFFFFNVAFKLAMQLLTASELQGHYGLFVGIVTSPDHFYNRHMARKTWLRYPKLRFFFYVVDFTIFV